MAALSPSASRPFHGSTFHSDRGSESPLMHEYHQFYANDLPEVALQDIYPYGTSVKNQRIESWWKLMTKGKMGKRKSYFRRLQGRASPETVESTVLVSPQWLSHPPSSLAPYGDSLTPRYLSHPPFIKSSDASRTPLPLPPYFIYAVPYPSLVRGGGLHVKSQGQFCTDCGQTATPSITMPGEPFSSYKPVCRSGILWCYRGGGDLIRCFDDVGGAALRIGNGSPRRYHWHARRDAVFAIQSPL